MGNNRSIVGVVIKSCGLVGTPVCCPFSVLMICDDIEELNANELEWSLFVTVITWHGETGDVAVTVTCSTWFCLPKCFEFDSVLFEALAIITSAFSFSFSFSLFFSFSFSLSSSISFSFVFSFSFGKSNLKIDFISNWTHEKN